MTIRKVARSALPVTGLRLTRRDEVFIERARVHNLLSLQGFTVLTCAGPRPPRLWAGTAAPPGGGGCG